MEKELLNKLIAENWGINFGITVAMAFFGADKTYLLPVLIFGNLPLIVDIIFFIRR